MKLTLQLIVVVLIAPTKLDPLRIKEMRVLRLDVSDVS